MNAVAERRAAALAGPGAAPVRIEVALRPEPQRLAHRDQRPAEGAGAEQFRGAAGAGPVPVLEDHVRGAAAGPFRLGDHVQLGQGRTRRLLDQHRPTGPEHLRRDLGVRAGRGGDADQVRASLAHQAGHIRVGRPAVGVGVRLGVLGHDVDQPDQPGAARSAYAFACWWAIPPQPTMATLSGRSLVSVRVLVMVSSCRDR